MKILVQAKPSSKEEYLTKIDEHNFIVAVHQPPIKGLANKAIVEKLSDYFNVSKSAVRIISGATSKNKVIGIEERAQ